MSADQAARAGDGKTLEAPALDDEALGYRLDDVYDELRKTGFNGGMAGVAWSNAVYRAAWNARGAFEMANASEDRAHAEAYYRQAEQLLTANEQTLRRDLARAHDSANGFVAEIKLLKQHIRELQAFKAMVNRHAPEFPADPEGPRDVWYWQGDGEDHLESMTHQLPVVIRAEQLRELLKQTTLNLCDRTCEAIHAADDKSMAEAGYMLDCNDCCRIVRDQFDATFQAPATVPGSQP